MLGPPPVSLFWNLSNKPEMDKCYHQGLQHRIWLWTMATGRSTGVLVTRRPLLLCNLPAGRQFERLPRHLSGSRYLSHHIFGSSCGRACPPWPRTCLEATTDNMFFSGHRRPRHFSSPQFTPLPWAGMSHPQDSIVCWY